MNAPKLPELPEPDTRSLAYSGRDVEYIEGYESGFESALESMRSYGTACFEAGVRQERERALDLYEITEFQGHGCSMYYIVAASTHEEAAAFTRERFAELVAANVYIGNPGIVAQHYINGSED